ncbi:MAG: flagellar export protein FliJ [Chitinivibrionales bacterium]|nr:flagellar export protein FliJ [Chitinivibrionales bacterium]MBD3357245.1 flagellar export protein FliJ [Chitinivibrionales bacterium]
MRRFRFPLQALLELRSREEEAVKLELGEKNRLVVRAQSELKTLHDQLKEFQSSERAVRAETHDIVALRHSVAFRHQLKAGMIRTARHIEELRGEAETVRQRLVAATRKRRAIELIRDRRYREWRREYNAREQSRIDEISQRKFIRDKTAAAKRSASA